MKKICIFTSILSLSLVVLFSISVNLVIGNSYNSRIYSNIDIIPHKRVALVLGTSKFFNGRPNLYYTTRLEAVFQLYKAKKIKKIVASGDHSRKEYNEPSDMKADLVSMGVSEQDIYLDYAGFRTLDSIVRAKKVFSLDDIIVVSQRSHCQRALFIADAESIDTIAFEACDITHPGKFLMEIREFMARVKAGIDIWIINKSPKFLGKKISVV